MQKYFVYTHSIETDIQAYADLIRSIGSTPDLGVFKSWIKKRLQNGHVTVENIRTLLKNQNIIHQVHGISVLW